MTRELAASFRAQVQMLAIQIGVRPAARACGLDEDRVRKWSQRGKWNVGNVASTIRGPSPSPQNVTSPIDAIQNVVQHYGDRAKIGATIAGARALEHLADADADTLVKPAHSIAADQWTKAVDRAAGWTQSRAAGVNVGVQVNITPPSEAERAERRSVHAKLDEITRALAR